ncbi:MAG: hypothetical protein IKU44_03565 [Firmicutes bacterium]|nr:hypothetical protein [Bacillota bacterium]
MKEETKQRFKKSLKPAIFVIVWLAAFIFIAPAYEAWKDNANVSLYFLATAVLFGIPAFAMFRVFEPWLDYEPEQKEPRRRKGKKKEDK